MSHNPIVVYTAIFGGYDGLLPQKKIKGVDFVCFSDRPLRAKPWEVRIVAPQYSDSTRCAREIKVRPHRYFPDHQFSIWIDGNYLIVGDVVSLIESLPDNANLAYFDHQVTKPDSRDCIYDEFESIMELGRRGGRFKDDPAIMKQQIERYRSEGYPPHNGLIFSSILLRRHHSPDVRKTMECWWNEIASGSRRDQLSFNYAVWKERLNCHVIDKNVRDNPWFFQIGIHRADYRWKLLRYRLRRFFGMG